MPRMVPISPTSHQNKSHTRYTDYHFAAGEMAAFIVGAELSRAVRAFPIGFIMQEGRYRLVALLSLVPEKNFFVAPDGKWLGAYVPAAFRSYPFQVAQDTTSGKHLFCVDEASGLVYDDPDTGDPFFDDQGNLTEHLKNTLNFLTQIEQNRTATHLAVAGLAEAGLIRQWPLTASINGEDKPVNGLYCIDEQKFNTLNDQRFLHLRNIQALPIAFAQMLSMGNIDLLYRLSKLQNQLQPAPADLGFSIDEADDMIRF